MFSQHSNNVDRPAFLSASYTNKKKIGKAMRKAHFWHVSRSLQRQCGRLLWYTVQHFGIRIFFDFTISHHHLPSYLMFTIAHLGWGWTAMTALHIRRSCTTCFFTPNKFISSITQSFHFFLCLPAICRPPTLTPHPIHPPSALFICPNHLSLLCLSF